LLFKTPTCQARLLFELFLGRMLLPGFSAAFFTQVFSTRLLFSASSLRLQPPGWLETNPAYKMGCGFIVFGKLQVTGFRITTLI
tara:strand:+ start:145 stop:396 length:252 start_codon:yes stop_codon:yes gene_type:complete